tara:strand:- start:185 stop:430 length:246 start_codon:yes stop_codon:yes gene_type:complete
MAKRRGLENPGYGPDPSDQLPVDPDTRIRYKTPPKGPSPSELTGKDTSMARFAKEAARQKALKKLLAEIKKTGQIPASPTR